MSLELSKEGIDKLEKLKLEHQEYSEIIENILELVKQGDTETALVALTVVKLIMKGAN